MTSELEPSAAPPEQLRALLELDFSPPSLPDPPPGQKHSALTVFLHHTRVAEDVEQRFISIENQELGQQAGQVLEAAPVTDSFKGFIVKAVREAHAWRRRVDDVVAPERLGLTRGDGIFDPEQAPELEAQAIRDYLVTVVARNVDLVQDRSQEGTRQGELRSLTLERYAQEIAFVDEWSEAVADTHGIDVFEGVDDDAFMDAARVVRLLDPDDPNDASWIALGERLREERNRRRDQDS
jgi:hypothetical protein